MGPSVADKKLRFGSGSAIASCFSKNVLPG